MNDTVLQLLKKGFRVTIGATATLIEVLQDPQRREQNLSRLRRELDQLAQEWAEKGEMTEQEARSFVDTLMAQRRADSDRAASEAIVTTTAVPVPPPSSEVLELQELTAQLAAIRAELAHLREQRDQ
jgi:polyhydroxyalkanoate synthesis regulator phasin